MAVFMPIGTACFSQCFAYIRVYYAKHAPERSDFMVTAMRTVFTLAWLIVPPAAGWVAAQFDVFNIYLASALSYIVVGSIFALLMNDLTTAVQVPTPVRTSDASLLTAFRLPSHILLGLLGLVVMTTALRILTYTTPLYIVYDLGGNLTDVGFYATITAAVEAPFMLVWGYLTTKLTKETLLSCAGLIVAVFLVASSVVSDLSVFYWLLILNGIGTAALMSINISYVQDAIAGRVGLSTSLLDVVVILSNLTGATAFGILTTGSDYRFALAVGAGVAVAGAAVMVLGNLSRIGRRSQLAKQELS